jgi:hypothetical protein
LTTLPQTGKGLGSGLAEIDLADIPLGLALGVLGIDVEPHAVGCASWFAAVDVVKDAFVILVDVTLFRVPLPQLIRLVPDDEVPDLAQEDLGAPDGQSLGGLVVPDIGQDGGIEFLRITRCREDHIDLEGLVVRGGTADVAALGKLNGPPGPVEIGVLPEIDTEGSLDPEP